MSNDLIPVEVDENHLLGLHDAGGEQIMLQAGRPGWILFEEVIGHDPDDLTSKDYSAFTELGLKVIVCLRNDHYPHGCLPHSDRYEDFARRCANFVRGSSGCRLWIVGNEMNYAAERPGVQSLVDTVLEEDPYLHGLPQRHNALHNLPHGGSQDGETDLARFVDAGENITPERYARCFQLCRQAIQKVRYHERDRVLTGAVAPWNTNTTYAGNAQGSWIKYFQDVLHLLGPEGCDGITLHVHTHGSDASLITDDSRLDAFPLYASSFQVYQDFMYAVPDDMRDLPVLITQSDQGQPWDDLNTGWVQEALAEIRHWNDEPGNQPISALILYRWQPVDAWNLNDKSGVLQDIYEAIYPPYGPGSFQPVGELEEAMQPRPAVASTRALEETAQPPSEVSESDTLAEQSDSSVPVHTGRGPHFRAQWLQSRLPDQVLHAGETIDFRVKIRNVGVKTWPHEGPDRVKLGYRFQRNRQELVSRQIFTPLPRDVAAEESVQLDAQVALPQEPGNYTLIVDLVHEGERIWFQDHKSDVLVRWLTIEARESTIENVSPDRPQGKNPEEAAVPVGARPRPVLKRPAMLSSTIATTSGGEDWQPTVVSVINQLPRGDAPYLHRPLDTIRSIVINHTGAPPHLPLQVVAQAHVDSGYPGIAYHYVVRPGGEILQVCDLQSAVTEDRWAFSAVHIALEGDFNTDPPPRDQLQATADLCAWLMSELQDVTLDDIIGLCELLPTLNPGATFLDGPHWRRNLRERTERRLQTPSDRGQQQAHQTDRAQPPPHKKMPAPPIEDVVTLLPRDARAFYSREPDDLRLIVINQTGVDPNVPLNSIADGFQERGLPGILYQYYITQEGVIFQTQPMMQVVDDEHPYIANAINIAFAGSFDQTIPSPEQLEAGGALIAWLVDEYPRLSLDDVKGVSELVSHRSPGEQWLRGQRWKEMLLQAVREAPSEQTGGLSRTAERALRRQLDELVQSQKRLQVEMTSVEREKDRLAQDNDRLRNEVRSLRSDPEQVHEVPAPPLVDLIEHLPREDSLSYEERPLSAIHYLVVHHTGTPPHVGPERIAHLHISADAQRGKEAWPGIGYHFFIHPDGTIAMTQPLERVCFHVADYNQVGVGIAFAGSFMNGALPTIEQIESGGHLIGWLNQHLNIPLEHVHGHREFDGNDTVCPGDEWLAGHRWRDRLIQAVVEHQKVSQVPG